MFNALGGPGKINTLLTGHSHFDHSFDTATWANLTGAPIIGPQTTCFQAVAQKIPASRCTSVVGGETIALADSVIVRVVRWNHSGDSRSNPEQHNPVELGAVPHPDPVTGGLRAGVAEDFPNGGGGRGFLFTVNGPDGPLTWFYQNSASAVDLNVPIVIGGVNYGAPLDRLKATMSAAGLTSVDLWIGTGGAPVAQLVLPILKPKAYLPIHWDGLDASFLAGVKTPYADPSLAALLTKSGVKLVKPVNYMDKWRAQSRRHPKRHEHGSQAGTRLHEVTRCRWRLIVSTAATISVTTTVPALAQDQSPAAVSMSRDAFTLTAARPAVARPLVIDSTAALSLSVTAPSPILRVDAGRPRWRTLRRWQASLIVNRQSSGVHVPSDVATTSAGDLANRRGSTGHLRLRCRRDGRLHL